MAIRNEDGATVAIVDDVEVFDYDKAGDIRMQFEVLSAIGRLNYAKFSLDLYEEQTGVQTRFAADLEVTARVPSCRLVTRYASRLIAAKSDDALLKLEQELRRIVAQDGKGSWLSLVPVVVDRMLVGAR